jgi:hypothetical protein
MVLGANVDVTPLGNPVTEKTTGALKPPLTATVSVMLLFDPAFNATELDEGVTRKAGELVASFQWLTRTEASTDPSPVVWSYPTPALNPVCPGTLLLPLVMSWNTDAPPARCLVARV